MARTTITFSLPAELSARLDQTARQEGRTRSALLRDALLRYIEESDWRRVLDYGKRRAKGRGITLSDVETLVNDYRARASPST